MIEEAVYSTLTGHSGLAALVGTRVYRHQLPIDATLPAVTFVRIATTPQPHRQNSQGKLRRTRFQFDCWAGNHGDARLVAWYLQQALAGINGTLQVDEWVYLVTEDGTFLVTEDGTFLVTEPYIGARVDVAIFANDLDIFEETPGRFRAVIDELIWHTT